MSPTPADIEQMRARLAEFEGQRLRCPLNPERIVTVKGAWMVATGDQRKFALWLTDGNVAYADAAGQLLGGWSFAD